ncbi:MAG: hypothetical protein J4G05_00025 [Chlorobi bacterium]|nr:hypothetical protein [Chlorobiota bacterium]
MEKTARTYRFVSKQVMRARGGHILVLLMSLVLFPVDLFGRQTTNLEQFQRCAEVVADTLFARTGDPDQLCVRIVSHQADWILDQACNDVAALRTLSLVQCQAPYTNELLIAITDIGVRYVELEDADFYWREVTLGVSASVPVIDASAQKRSRVTERFGYALNDTVDASSIAEIESPGYDFTVGTTIRLNRSSFWKSVAEPAIVIGTSVVMVILLFTARSQ